MNNLADNKYLVFGKLGSFWSEKLKGQSRDFAKALIGLSKITSATDELIQPMRNLSNNAHAMMGNIVLSFAPRDVAVLGPDLQKRLITVYSPDATKKLAFSSRPSPKNDTIPTPINVTLSQTAQECLRLGNNNYLSLTVNSADPDPDIYVLTEQDVLLNKYLVPIPDDLTVIQIRTHERVLLCGIDFEQGQGVLIFNEQPSSLFPNHKIFVTSAIKKIDNLLNYSVAVEPVHGDISHIAAYYRYAQAAKTFELAVARACDFFVFEENSLLLRASGNFYKRIYEFDTGTVAVEYPHDKLIVGTTYKAGTVLGNAIRVFSQLDLSAVNWYRQFSWSGGLDMSALGPYEGVTMPSGFVSAYRPVGSPHVQLNVTGTTFAKQNYWNQCASGEIASGQYLKDIIPELAGIAEGETRQIDGIALLFEYVLKEKAWIMQTKGFDFWSLEIKNRFNQFVTREKPFGAVLLRQDEALVSPYTDEFGLLFDLVPSSMYLPLIT